MQNFSEASGCAPAEPALRAMFEARKRVFVDLLKWEVPVLDGRYEIDQFDTRDAWYLILADADADAQHRASARLLRTDRAHILADLFPVLCRGAVPRGEAIREITRFCIEPTLSRADRLRVRNQLVTALVEHALRARIAAYTAVANLQWFRQIERFGWRCCALGPALRLGGETLVAVYIEIDRDTPDALARTGIYDPGSYRLAGDEREFA
jgi:acyl homoserine lactone synthase/acyl-homoserine lactone synthase